MNPDLHSRLKPLIFPMVITLIMTAIMLAGSTTNDWLKYDRITIQQGELWRMMTSHFTHLNWAHAAMNILGFWLYWLFFGKQFKLFTHACIIFVSTIPISLGLLMFNPDLRWYVGFSGVLHALFVGACLLEIRTGRKDSLILLALMCGKLTWEFFAGPLPGSEETVGGTVIVDAHLYGAISGMVIAVALMLWSRPSTSSLSIK